MKRRVAIVGFAALAGGLVLWGCEDNSARMPAKVARKEAEADAAMAQPMDRQPALFITQRTTVLYEPRKANGGIDYVAGLNLASSKGVKAEDNALTGLVQAIGPGFAEAGALAALSQALGVPPPTPKAEDFIEWETFASPRLDDAATVLTPQGTPAWQAGYAQAQAAPWKASERPLLAEWLRFNEIPLNRAAQALARSAYHRPILPLSALGAPPASPVSPAILAGPDGPVLWWLADPRGPEQPGHGACLRLAEALACRACRWLGEGDGAKAWADVLAVYRLARDLSQEPLPRSQALSLKIEKIASDAALACAFHGVADANAARRMLADMNALPAPGETWRMAERYAALELAAWLHAQGWPGLLALVDLADKATLPAPRPRSNQPALVFTEAQQAALAKPASGGATLFDAPLPEVAATSAPAIASEAELTSRHALAYDVNQAMVAINHWLEQAAVAGQVDTFAARVAALDDIEQRRRFAGLDALGFLRDPAKRSALLSLPMEQARPHMSRLAGQLIACVLGAEIGPARRARDVADMRTNLAKVAIALEGYRWQSGGYPQTPDAASPDFLPAPPRDLFTGKPLRYLAGKQGYLLYSVGPNMEDDRASTSAKDPTLDLVARHPKASGSASGQKVQDF